MALRAVVIGTGWAGEGHTKALRKAGVEVIAMCGRTPEPARAMAQKLGIQDIRFDWHQALAELKPDIVTIATPAAPHCEMAEAAAELGCHILCDKPLAVNATQARTMLLSAEKAGVKHAYGTSSRYTPAAIHTHNLLADAFIGEVHEIESIVHLNMPSLLPYHWVHQSSQGGGLLNNMFTHALGQVLYMTGGEVLSAAGEARYLINQAPVAETLHDFRDLFQAKVDLENVKEWRTVDADTGYTVVLQLEMGHTVSACFQASGVSQNPQPNYTAFYGSKGSLYLTGPNGPNRIQYCSREDTEWKEIEVPQEIIQSLPQSENHVQNCWDQLFHEFVADIRGEGDADYPTFRDGWIASEIIEIVVSNRLWTPLPKHPVE